MFLFTVPFDKGLHQLVAITWNGFHCPSFTKFDYFTKKCLSKPDQASLNLNVNQLEPKQEGSYSPELVLSSWLEDLMKRGKSYSIQLKFWRSQKTMTKRLNGSKVCTLRPNPIVFKAKSLVIKKVGICHLPCWNYWIFISAYLGFVIKLTNVQLTFITFLDFQYKKCRALAVVLKLF